MLSRTILILLAVTAAAPALAQDRTPSSIGPNDLDRTGMTGTTVPRNELVIPGAGIALRNSAGDVSRPTGIQDEVEKKARELSEARRAEALALAERVKKGAEVPPALVATLRDALLGDIELWRQQYQVGAKDVKAMRERWLRDPGSLSAAEWVLWRAAWFDERDKWIAQSQSASR